MSKVEDDYSDYITYMSNINRNYGTMAGVAFTTLTLLITLLPDPSEMFAQVTLFFVMFVCVFLDFLAGWGSTDLLYFCRKVPPLTKQLRIFNYLSLSGYSLLGLIFGLMFLVKNLMYLALVSWLVWIVFLIAMYVVCWKPFGTYRATRARMLARAREKEKAV
jgi:predicted neutral ceramidase superfamily lipid hydrolase